MNLPISPVAQPRPVQTFHTFTAEEMTHSEENSNFANLSDLIAPPRPKLTMSNSLPTKSQALPQLGATPTPSADKLDELKKQIDEVNLTSNSKLHYLHVYSFTLLYSSIFKVIILKHLKRQSLIFLKDFNLDIKLIDQTKPNQQKPKNISSSVKGHLKSMSTSAASIVTKSFKSVINTTNFIILETNQ
jgi:hypothetical protein